MFGFGNTKNLTVKNGVAKSEPEVGYIVIPSSEQWVLVKSLMLNINKAEADGKFYYHLFEAQTGARKVTFTCTFVLSHDALKAVGEKFDDYHNVVYPWLHGRVNLDIPTYSQAKQDDLATVLKGK